MALLRLSRRSALCASAILVPLLQGCATIPTWSGGRIHVESEPSGASVHVMGREVGRTPIDLGMDQVFPPTYRADQEEAYGKVMLRKAGCAEHVQRVSAADVSKGVRVRLDCGQARPIEPGVRNDAASPERPEVGASADASVRDRLLRLDRLREDGLITEPEYRQIRQRILDEL